MGKILLLTAIASLAISFNANAKPETWDCKHYVSEEPGDLVSRTFVYDREKDAAYEIRFGVTDEIAAFPNKFGGITFIGITKYGAVDIVTVGDSTEKSIASGHFVLDGRPGGRQLWGTCKKS